MPLSEKEAFLFSVIFLFHTLSEKKCLLPEQCLVQLKAFATCSTGKLKAYLKGVYVSVQSLVYGGQHSVYGGQHNFTSTKFTLELMFHD